MMGSYEKILIFFLRHWIMPAFMKGVTTKYSPCAHPDPFKDAMYLNGLYHIGRASGCVATTLGEEGADQSTIEFDQTDNNGLHFFP